MTGYYLAALALLAGALAALTWAYLDARQHARAAEDAFRYEADDHERTRERLAQAEQAAADNLTSLGIVLDAHARDIVHDPLGSDLIADELSLVKGGRHG
jgi:alkylation response protein AidB-like acyl-CoA dehydrogenase